MIDAIVYHSNTGFTKQYAYSFAVETHLPIYSIEEIKKIPKGSTIIFFSWIKDGKITELKRVKDYVLSYVCCCGIFPYSEEYKEELKSKNEIEHLFYLRGGLRYYRLNMLERKLFSDIRKRYEKKKKSVGLSMEETEFLSILINGSESIRLDALKPLIEWTLEEQENIVC